MTSGTYTSIMLILDRERRKRRGKGQADAQVSFKAAKRAPIGYYYRCKYTFFQTEGFISNFPLLVHGEYGQSCSFEG